MRRLVILSAIVAVIAVMPGGVTLAGSSTVSSIGQPVVGLDQAGAGSFFPPNVQVAAGPGAVVELVNVAGAVWSKGGERLATLDLHTLFGAPGGDRLTDPRVLYDAVSGRWFASILDLTANSTRLAVSTGGDPTQGWRTWEVPAALTGGTCPDEPMLGTSDLALVLALTVYASATCPARSLPLPVGDKVWVIAKRDLLAGGGLHWRVFGPDLRYFAATPAQALGATDTAYLAAVDPLTSAVVHVFTIAGAPSSATRIVETDLPIDPLSLPPSGVQAGSSVPISTSYGRVLDAAWQSGILSVATNDACTPADDTVEHACARVLRITTATAKVATSLELDEPQGDVFYPALRPDGAGNLAVVYGHASASEYPGVAVRYLRPDGTWSGAFDLATGTAPETSGRYGDYFGAALDPADPGQIWVGGELGPPAGTASEGWRTVLAAVRPSGLETAFVVPPGWPATLSFSGPGDAALRIEASPDGAAWTTLADLTTDAGGTASYTFSPAATAYYRAVIAGSPPGAPVLGFVRPTGAARLTLTAASHVITWSSEVTLSVHLTDAAGVPEPDRKVQVAASTDGATWSPIASVTTDAQGTATLSYRAAGNLRYRAVFGATPDLGPAASPTLRVLVRQLALLRPSNAGTRTVRRGTTVEFATTIRALRPERRAVAIYRVFHRAGPGWVRAAEEQVSADAAGVARLAWTFSQAGQWYVIAMADPTPTNTNSVWSEPERYAVQ
jgi:hypothetical protein